MALQIIAEKKYNKVLSKSKLLILILVLIGCQQFPVINVGGSLKIYEILGLFMLLYYGINAKCDVISRLLLGLFVVSPILSLVSFYICDDVSSFYHVYGETRDSFRFNIFIFPILQLLYMLMNYVVYYNLYYTKTLYYRFETIKKWIILGGTLIAVYSILSLFVGDIITLLPNFIQNKHVYGSFRASGFSQEPSSYVFYQGWIILMLYYSKHSFASIKWVALMVINVLALLLTFSSSIVAFIGVVFLMIMLFAEGKYRLLYLLLLIGVLFGCYIFISRYVDFEMLNYAFITKIEDFIFGKDDAGGSGGFRNYTASLGWILWRHNPFLGVGVGNSVYFMHEADKEIPIIPMGEQLHPGSFPQNAFACVFSEQGIIGGSILILLLAFIIRQVWKYREEKYGKLFLAGTLFNICSFMVIAPIYSMFLWVYMFMALGYIRCYRNKEFKLRSIQ